MLIRRWIHHCARPLGALSVAVLANALLILGLLAMNSSMQASPPDQPQPVQFIAKSSRSTSRTSPNPDRPGESDQAPQARDEPMHLSAPAPHRPEGRPNPVKLELKLPAISRPAVKRAMQLGAASTANQSRSKATATDSASEFGQSTSPPQGTQSPDQGPRTISAPNPSYPEAPRAKGVEGWAQVKLLIDERGQVERASIVGLEGPRAFGQAVLDVIDQWKFQPAFDAGHPVKVWATKTVRFNLAG